MRGQEGHLCLGVRHGVQDDLKHHMRRHAPPVNHPVASVKQSVQNADKMLLQPPIPSDGCRAHRVDLQVDGRDRKLLSEQEALITTPWDCGHSNVPWCFDIDGLQIAPRISGQRIRNRLPRCHREEFEEAPRTQEVEQSPSLPQP